MFPKRFIYRNGILIPKTSEKGIQSDIIFQEKDNNYKYVNQSRNGNLINIPNLMPNIFLSEIKKNAISKSQEDEEKKINEFNNINEETQTNSDFQKNNNKNNDLNTDINNNFEKDNNFNNNIKNLKIFTRPKKSMLYQQIEQICQHLYLNQNNTNKNSVFNEMYQKENEYIKNLKKNYLSNEDLILRRKHSYRNFSRLINHSLSVQSNSVKNSKIRNNKSYKSSKISEENINSEIKKKYFDEDMKNTTNNKNEVSHKHNINIINSYMNKYQIVNKIKGDEKMKLPAIKSSKKLPIELSNLIPIKKGIKREDNLNEYMFYKVMKSNRLKKFHL